MTDELQVEVSWPDPIYKDNSGVLDSINSTHISPHVFNIGIHNVTFYAWDPSGNIANCSITIKVTGMQLLIREIA